MSGQKTASKPLDQKTTAELEREAKARLIRLDPATAAIVVDEVIGKRVAGSVNGFMAFLHERAVIGLAIGFVAGSQVQAVVAKFTSSIVDPLLDLMIPGNRSLTSLALFVRIGDRTAEFRWGELAFALLNFLFALLVIYVIVKSFKLDRLDKHS